MCRRTDFIRQDEVDAGACHGAFGLYRGGTWSIADLLAFSGVCRCRSERTAYRIWQSVMERCEGSSGSGGIYRYLYGRFQSQCGGNIGGIDFRLFGILDFRTEDEEVKGRKK